MCAGLRNPREAVAGRVASDLVGSGPDGPHRLGFEAIKMLKLESHSVIPSEGISIADQKIPVEGRERAGIRADRFVGIHGTGPAVVAHSRDILPAGGIRLRGHVAAVRIL